MGTRFVEKSNIVSPVTMDDIAGIELPGRSKMLLLVPIVFAYFFFRAVYNRFFHPLANIPGPHLWAVSRLPYVWALLRGTIVHDFDRLHRQYGSIVRVAPDEVIFSTDEARNDIFQPRNGQPPFPKDEVWWRTQPGQQESILSAIDPDLHSRIRKVLQPGFTLRALKEQEPIIQRYANLLVDRLGEAVSSSSKDKDNDRDRDGWAEIDIMPWFNFFTFDVFGDLGFGESFECLQHSRFHPWVELLFKAGKSAAYVGAARFYPLIEKVLLKCVPPSLKKMATDHYLQIAEKVQRRLNYELERPDIMSHVIEGDYKSKMTMGEINTTFTVLTTAGSETTATCLTGTMNSLVQNPETLAILTKEVRDAFQSENEVDLDSLKKLPYLNAVLNEGLRLCTPVPWVLPRVVPRGGDTVDGQWLPEGTHVSIQPYTMNKDPVYFTRPNSFLPERWLPEAVTDEQSPFFNDQRRIVQAFSIGPRNCIGQHLAWAEMRLSLAKIVWTFDIELVEEKRLRWDDLRTFLFVEKKAVQIRMKHRDR